MSDARESGPVDVEWDVPEWLAELAAERRDTERGRRDYVLDRVDLQPTFPE